MREFESELVEYAEVKVVTFDSEKLAREYRAKFNLSWPLLLDPELELYRANGMDKGSWWALASPRRIMRYLGDIFSGSLPGKKGKDIRQLGGDIVIDPDGLVQLFHPSQTPHDRPSANDIVELVSASNV